MDSSRPQLHIDTHNGSNVVMRLIDDLSIEHNGNQITSGSDAVDENLDYEGTFDFINNNTEEENQYDGNGAILFDAGKQQYYTYDLLGHLKSVSIGACTIEYVYATDGRKLRAIHSQMFFTASGTRTPNITTISDTTDYVGNLILKNGKPQMYQFAGGYYSFDGDKKPECHYYIADYQGNNRMVVNADKDSIEQITHYYPYGGIIGNLSSNQEAQKYKYSNKELDRTYGLDLYDFQARLFNPALPVFDRPDPLAEKYYSISPYAYCAGDPVNCVDPDGKKVLDSKDARVIKECMMTTSIGQEVWNSMEATTYPISIKISCGNYKTNHPNGESVEKNPLAVTNISSMEETNTNGDKSTTISSASIEFFQEPIEDVFYTVQGSTTNFDNNEDPRSRYTQNMTDREQLTLEDVMGATATHEGIHATDTKSNKVGEPNKVRREDNPIKYEILYIQQLGK